MCLKTVNLTVLVERYNSTSNGRILSNNKKLTGRLLKSIKMNGLG